MLRDGAWSGYCSSYCCCPCWCGNKLPPPTCAHTMRPTLPAGAAFTKWAIEYEHPAAEAFKLNNPDAGGLGAGEVWPARGILQRLCAAATNLLLDMLMHPLPLNLRLLNHTRRSSASPPEWCLPRSSHPVPAAVSCHSCCQRLLTLASLHSCPRSRLLQQLQRAAPRRHGQGGAGGRLRRLRRRQGGDGQTARGAAGGAAPAGRGGLHLR